MSQDNGYNGWSNYETWCVNLWIDNEEGSHRYWREVAQEIAANAEPKATTTDRPDGTREESARFELADRLKDEIGEALPEVDGMWVDLMRGALSEVNWGEIASGILEGVEFPEVTDRESE